MSILADLDLERLGPARLWRVLDASTRERAARAMWTSEDDDVRVEASMALARQLRFRPQFVARLPLDKRVGYLARQVRPDDSLAGSLLLALHLAERRALLGTFLDALEIPHREGVIDEDHDLLAPNEGAVAEAVTAVDGRFARDDVDVYLAALLAADPETWQALRSVLIARRDAA